MIVPSDVALTLGENLRRVRRRAALSQEALASLAGVHRTEIGLLENGQRLPRADTLVKLADSLEAPTDELLDGINWRPAAASFGSFALRGRGA